MNTGLFQVLLLNNTAVIVLIYTYLGTEKINCWVEDIQLKHFIDTANCLPKGVANLHSHEHCIGTTLLYMLPLVMARR